MTLTKAEKAVVAQFLAAEGSLRKFWWEISPFLMPPIAFASYGLWKHELVAIALAFVVLLFLVLWYLTVQFRSWTHFHSALRKYEDAVRALEQPDADECQPS